MASKVELLKQDGNRCFKNKDFKKAIILYKEGLQIEPRNINLNANLAQACLADGSFADAEVHAVVTLALQQNSEKGYYRAAKAAYSRKKKPRAITYLRQGLVECPKSEDLLTLFRQIKEEDNPQKGTKEGGSKMAEKDSESESEEEGKLRSRSTSRLISSTALNGPKVISGLNQRSISVNRTTVLTNNQSVSSKNRKKKKKRGPIEIEDIQNDKFLQTVETLRDEHNRKMPSLIARDSHFLKEKRESTLTMRTKLQKIMKDGSETLVKGLPRKAADLYKEALDLLVGHDLQVFGMKEIDYVVLRYAISVSWTETSNYVDIVKSVEYLTDIEDKHSAKLPAVHYALGNVFFKLNRFKVALEHLEKGVRIVEKGLKIITHPWPGTTDIIKETTKIGLEESLRHLMVSCKLYHVPHAICRHENCLKVSTHIIPSLNIFYSDPDYIGFVVVRCQEECKVKYHIGCWKDYKESLNVVEKLSDKDFLGRPCVTLDCVTENNKQSVIIKIEIYGENGDIKSQCSKEPIMDVTNIKGTKKTRKKKHEKPTDNTRHGKVQTRRPREQKLTADSVSAEPTHSTQGMISESEQLADGLKRLTHLRNIDFGYKTDSYWYPHQDYFGRSDIACLEKSLNPECVEDSQELRVKKEFVFSYFYEFILNEGPQNMMSVEEKWKKEVSGFPGVDDFPLKRNGICKFLLESYCFAALDDTLCLAEQLSSTYPKIKAKLSEQMSFMIQNNTEFLICHIKKNIQDTEQENRLDNELSKYNAEEMLSHFSSDVPLQSNTQNDTFFSDDEDYDDDEDDDDDLEFESDDDSEDLIYVNGSSEDDKLVDLDVDDDVKSVEAVTVSKNAECENGSQDSKDADIVDEAKIVISQDNGVTVVLQPESINMVEEVVSEKKLDVTSSKSDVVSEVVEDTSAVLDSVLNRTIVKIDQTTQTEVGRNFEEEIEQLNCGIAELEEELQKSKDANETIATELKSEMKKREDTLIKNHEEKVISIQNQKDTEIQSLQIEITKKDSRFETWKKKNNDKIDKLNKKVNEDNVQLKTNQATIQELTKSAEVNKTLIQQTTLDLNKSLTMVFDTKKALGEFKIGIYNQKCIERLESMYSMVKYLTETSTPTLTYMMDAIREWEKVMVELSKISEKFQNHYLFLLEWLKDEIKFGETPELELPKLPDEPPYPMSDMENILRKAMEQLRLIESVEDAGEAVTKNNIPPVTTVHANNIRSTAAIPMYQPTFSQVQGPNLYMTNPVATLPYRPYPIPITTNSAYGMPMYPVHVPGPVPHNIPHHPGFSLPNSIGLQEDYKKRDRNGVTSVGNKEYGLDFTGASVKTNASFIPEARKEVTTVASPVPDTENESSLQAIESKNTNADEVMGQEQIAKEIQATVLEKKKEAGSSSFEKNGVKRSASKEKLLGSTVERGRSPTPPGQWQQTRKPMGQSSLAGLIPIDRKAPSTVPTPSINRRMPLLATPVLASKPSFSKPEVTGNHESKPVLAPTKRGNYQKLITELQKKFPTKTEAELSSCVTVVREKNKNTLTGLTIPTIFRMVEKVLAEKSSAKQGAMGLDKFGGTAWGGVNESTTTWNKPAADPDEECIICMLNMTSDVASLHCKHTFHSQCIRKWLKEESICPICRVFTRMSDEFPPLG